MSISAVITTVAGEEKYLPTCLASIKDFVDEIIIVDMSGSAGITKIAKEYHAKIFDHELVNYVEPVRNFGINNATSDWVLILDPDEEIPGSLIKKFNEIIENNEADFVRIPRKNIVFGKALKHSRFWPDYNIRFFKRGKVVWSEIIHGVPETTGKGVDLEGKEEFAITHHHYESIEQFLERMNRYTTIQANLKSKEYKFDWKDLIRKPAAEFLSRFFAGEAYKDGVHGLALSILQAFSENILYLKLWQLEKFGDKPLDLKETLREIDSAKRELNYWQADSEIKMNGGVIPRLRRKLKI